MESLLSDIDASLQLEVEQQSDLRQRTRRRRRRVGSTAETGAACVGTVAAPLQPLLSKESKQGKEPKQLTGVVNRILGKILYYTIYEYNQPIY